jgi:hypothetical protein
MFKGFDKCLDKLLFYMKKLHIIIFINTNSFLTLLVSNLRSKALMSISILFKTLFYSLVMKTIMKGKNILGWYR